MSASSAKRGLRGKGRHDPLLTDSKRDEIRRSKVMAYRTFHSLHSKNHATIWLLQISSKYWVIASRCPLIACELPDGFLQTPDPLP
jgi:hypothetical protein